jgi:hypothetical protein
MRYLPLSLFLCSGTPNFKLKFRSRYPTKFDEIWCNKKVLVPSFQCTQTQVNLLRFTAIILEHALSVPQRGRGVVCLRECDVTTGLRAAYSQAPELSSA